MAPQTTPLLLALSQFGFNDAVITLDDKSELTLLEVARILPQRRLVCRATWQGKLVYCEICMPTAFSKTASCQSMYLLA